MPACSPCSSKAPAPHHPGKGDDIMHDLITRADDDAGPPIGGMSFRVVREELDESGEIPLRTIQEVALYEVGTIQEVALYEVGTTSSGEE